MKGLSVFALGSAASRHVRFCPESGKIADGD
jgi:hypothetical protein